MRLTKTSVGDLNLPIIRYSGRSLATVTEDQLLNFNTRSNAQPGKSWCASEMPDSCYRGQCNFKNHILDLLVSVSICSFLVLPKNSISHMPPASVRGEIKSLLDASSRLCICGSVHLSVSPSRSRYVSVCPSQYSENNH